MGFEPPRVKLGLPPAEMVRKKVVAKLALEDLKAEVLTFEMLLEITSIDVWLARIPEAAIYKPCVSIGGSLCLG
jgi:hypothetical protein